MVQLKFFQKTTMQVLWFTLLSVFLTGCPELPGSSLFDDTESGASELTGDWKSLCRQEPSDLSPTDFSTDVASLTDPQFRRESRYSQESVKASGNSIVTLVDQYSDSDCTALVRRLRIESKFSHPVQKELEDTDAQVSVAGPREIDISVSKSQMLFYATTEKIAEILTKYCDGDYAVGSSFTVSQHQTCKFPPRDDEQAAFVAPSGLDDLAGSKLYSIYEIRGQKLFIGIFDDKRPERDGQSPATRLLALQSDELIRQ